MKPGRQSGVAARHEQARRQEPELRKIVTGPFGGVLPPPPAPPKPPAQRTKTVKVKAHTRQITQKPGPLETRAEPVTRSQAKAYAKHASSLGSQQNRAVGAQFGKHVSLGIPDLNVLHTLGTGFSRTGSDLASAARHFPGGVMATGGALKYDFLHDPPPSQSHFLNEIVKPTAHQMLYDLTHPGQHPGFALLDALALAAPITRAATAGRIATEVGEGSRATAFVNALVKKPPVKPRLFQVGEETARLQPSKSGLIRAGQGFHDFIVRAALKDRPDSRIARYGNWRLGGSLAETRRYRLAMQKSIAEEIASEGRRLPRKTRQAMKDALRLTSEQTLPAEAIRTAERSIQAGENVATNRAWLKRLQAVEQGGYLKHDASRAAGAQVFVDATRFPRLAEVDRKLAAGAAKRDEILASLSELDPAELQKRLDEPNIIHAGGEWEAPTPGKHGIPSQALLRQRSEVGRLQTLHDRALDKAPEAQRTRNLGSALSVAKDKLQSMEAAAVRRVKPTGIVGADPARPGRSFVSYQQTEPLGASQVTRAPGPVLGGVRNLIPKSKRFTGASLKAGLVPSDTTGLVSRGLIRAYKRANTEEFRAQLARMGSDVKRSTHDILVSTQEIKNARISDLDRALLGQKKLTVEEEVAHATSFRDWLEQAIPGHRDKFGGDRMHPLGTPAPEGYRWVPKGLLAELGKLPANADPGWLIRRLNDVNAAVTTATVYLKPGHIATRAGTNAFANIIQGSSSPLQIGHAVRLWRQLTFREKARALGAAGQGGFAALPHEGANLIGRTAGKGALWWSRHADAPFRFNSIAYEARKAGIKTATQFRQFLDDVENPEGLSAEEHARIDGIARRSNREQIAYDRLSEFERRRLTTLFWFYPWTAASVRFAGNTLLEHPLKATATADLGRRGEERQAQELGMLPFVNQGLFKIGGGNKFPTVLDLSTTSPFATPAEVVETAQNVLGGHFNQAAPTLSRFANPGVSAVGRLAYGLNEYGDPVTGSQRGAFLRTLLSPTPEYGFYRDVTGQGKTFPVHGVLPSIEHFLTKPGGPRTLDRARANKEAEKEYVATLEPGPRITYRAARDLKTHLAVLKQNAAYLKAHLPAGTSTQDVDEALPVAVSQARWHSNVFRAYHLAQQKKGVVKLTYREKLRLLTPYALHPPKGVSFSATDIRDALKQGAGSELEARGIEGRILRLYTAVHTRFTSAVPDQIERDYLKSHHG